MPCSLFVLPAQGIAIGFLVFVQLRRIRDVDLACRKCFDDVAGPTVVIAVRMADHDGVQLRHAQTFQLFNDVPGRFAHGRVNQDGMFYGFVIFSVLEQGGAVAVLARLVSLVEEGQGSDADPIPSSRFFVSFLLFFRISRADPSLHAAEAASVPDVHASVIIPGDKVLPAQRKFCVIRVPFAVFVDYYVAISYIRRAFLPCSLLYGVLHQVL